MLHLEIVAPRHQLAITSRSLPPRPRLTALDRALWVWVSSVLDVEEPASHQPSGGLSRWPQVNSRNVYRRSLEDPRRRSKLSAVVYDSNRGLRTVKSTIMSSMKLTRNIIIVLALLSVALLTSACPEKGPAEKAGEKIDNAIDKTKDAAKDATK